MRILTFGVDADSFSIDIPEDLARADRALRNCPVFQGGY